MIDSMSRRHLLRNSTLLAMASVCGPAFAQSVPRSNFGAESTAEEVTAGIDLSGKTAVVTGCNSGIGYETMRVLALRGAHVIGTARSLEKGRDAANSVTGRVTPVVLELTDFDSIVACADQIQAMDVSIDMLVLNAGVLLTQLRQVRGLEMQFVVNHLGHFILGNRLMNRVTDASEGRVVVVGSAAHRRVPDGGIQFDNLSGEGWHQQAYGHSKLANGLYSLELSRRLAGTRATSNAIHPGGVRTNILRNTGREGGGFGKSPEQGAATQCYVATNPALAGVTGQYFADCNPAGQSDHQTDAAMAARLWRVSEELTGDYLI
jgi:NAD(P)-dependent dehydrogenase (short-subunit alcohol dehydrogenase family)